MKGDRKIPFGRRPLIGAAAPDLFGVGISAPGTPGSGSRGRRSVPRGSFGADVFKLVTGTVFAQGITLALSPYLTRLYPPQAFGVWAIFSSITTIIGVVACLRYDVTITLPETEEEGASLLGVSLLAVAVVSLVSLVVVLLGRSAIVSALRAPEISPWLWMVPLAVFVNGIALAWSAWAARGRRFGLLAGTRVSASAASSTVQLGLGYSGWATAGSLIFSSVAGTGVQTVALGTQIGRSDGAVLRRGFRWSALCRGIHRYREFPTYGAISVLLNTISWQLPAILLQRFFSAEVVGFYALGNRVLRVPMELVGGAISQAFYPRVAAARAAGQLTQVVEGTYRRLVTIGFAPMVVLGIVAKDLFGIAFGARWAEAGVYTQILSLWTLFWFISSPLSSLVLVLEMQRFALTLNVVILATRFLALTAGGLLGDARLALVLFAASGVVVYGYYSFAILAAAGVRWGSAARILGSGVAAVSPIAVVLVATKAAGAPPWAVVLTGAVSLIAYLWIVVRRDSALLEILASLRRARTKPEAPGESRR